MNRLPEHDDIKIRRLLDESGVDESPELLAGLQRLRSYTGDPAPVPTGELADMLSEAAKPVHKRPQHRNRGLILSFTLAAAMAAGATGVAANTGTGLRLTGESPASAEILEHVSVPETTAGGDTDPGALASPDDILPADTDDTDPAALPAESSAPGAASVPADPLEAAEPEAGQDGGSPVPPAGRAGVSSNPGRSNPDRANPGPSPAEEPEREDDDGAPGDSGKPGRSPAADGGSGPGDRHGSDRHGSDRGGSSGNGPKKNGPDQNGPGRSGAHPEGSRGPEQGGNSPRKTSGPGSSKDHGAPGQPQPGKP